MNINQCHAACLRCQVLHQRGAILLIIQKETSDQRPQRAVRQQPREQAQHQTRGCWSGDELDVIAWIS